MGTNVLHMDTAQLVSRRVAAVMGKALTDAGISRREAADRSGIPLTTLMRRLRGHSPFTYLELVTLADIAGVRVSDIAAAAEQQEAS